MRPIDRGYNVKSTVFGVSAAPDTCISVRLDVKLIVFLCVPLVRLKVQLYGQFTLGFVSDRGQALEHVPPCLFVLCVAQEVPLWVQHLRILIDWPVACILLFDFLCFLPLFLHLAQMHLIVAIITTLRNTSQQSLSPIFFNQLGLISLECY